MVYQYIKSSDNNGNVISSELQYINFSDWQSKGQDLNSKIIGNFYEVKPYKITTEGANLISNGTFDTNITGWSRLPSTAAIAWVSSVGLDGGVVKFTSSDTTLSNQALLISKGFSIQTGKTYEIKFSVISDKWRNIDAGIRRNSGSYDWLINKNLRLVQPKGK